MKKVMVGLILLAVALVLVVSLSADKATKRDSATQASNLGIAARPEPPAATDHHPAAVVVPAYLRVAPKRGTLAPTLSPELFSGNKRLAYQAAKEIPETLAQLPCYCHCDRSAGHQSLHSCFESEHGENCGVCIGEALMAHQLEKRGKVSVAEIRERVIAAYGPASNQ